MAKKPLFQICDISPDTVYTPGSKVVGRVTLTAESDIAVGSVTVTFTGRSKSKIYAAREQSSESTSRGRITLFSFPKILYRGRYTLAKDKEFEWPFEFIFPEKPEFQYSELYSEAEDFECDSDHVLPPSFRSQPVDATSECYVVYELSATLERPGTFRSLFGKLTDTATLEFAPPRSPDAVMEEEPTTSELAETFHTTLKPPTVAPQGFRERLRSIFRSPPPPAVSTFTLTTKVPRTAISGSSLPLSIALSYDDVPDPSTPTTVTNPSPPPRPQIHLERVLISLQTVTKVRSPTHNGSWAATSRLLDLNQHFLFPSSESVMPNSSTTNGPPTPGFTHAIPLKTDLIPSFKTYNIALAYTLTISITITCNTETMQTKDATCALVLLPEHLASPSYEPPIEAPPPAFISEMDATAPSSSSVPLAEGSSSSPPISRRPVGGYTPDSKAEKYAASNGVGAAAAAAPPLSMHPAMRQQHELQAQIDAQTNAHTTWVDLPEENHGPSATTTGSWAPAHDNSLVHVVDGMEQLPAYEERPSRHLSAGPVGAVSPPSGGAEAGAETASGTAAARTAVAGPTSPL
ncbi:MAG: hypothetical protein M1819_004927 [Sarea resinae]|nr:MAG: hypothetical protein M1819_004927 [Sarea resinae]